MAAPSTQNHDHKWNIFFYQEAPRRDHSTFILYRCKECTTMGMTQIHLVHMYSYTLKECVDIFPQPEITMTFQFFKKFLSKVEIKKKVDEINPLISVLNNSASISDRYKYNNDLVNYKGDIKYYEKIGVTLVQKSIFIPFFHFSDDDEYSVYDKKSLEPRKFVMTQSSVNFLKKFIKDTETFFSSSTEDEKDSYEYEYSHVYQVDKYEGYSDE